MGCFKEIVIKRAVWSNKSTTTANVCELTGALSSAGVLKVRARATVTESTGTDIIVGVRGRKRGCDDWGAVTDIGSSKSGNGDLDPTAFTDVSSVTNANMEWQLVASVTNTAGTAVEFAMIEVVAQTRAS